MQNGHSNAPASKFNTDEERLRILRDPLLWPQDHEVEGTFETIDGIVI